MSSLITVWIRGKTFADAILDRLVHNAYRLDLDGPSMRKKTGQEAASEIDEENRG